MSNGSGPLGDASFVRGILESVLAGQRVVLCTVLATEGSAPRHAGAHMAVTEDGTSHGTVGGGAVEARAHERARALLEGGASSASGWMGWMVSGDMGMMCGGKVLMALRVIGEADLAVLETLSGCDNDVKWLVEDWSRPDRPRWRVDTRNVHDVDEMTSWNEVQKCYVEQISPLPRAIVFGGGHIGSALVPVLENVGFRVTVFDEREEVVSSVRSTLACEAVLGDFRDISTQVELQPNDYVVIVTPFHDADLEVLAQALASPACYVGCMGSKGKTARFAAALAGRGFSQEAIARACMPIGDPIDAVTPAELAISIVAEMIRWRAGREPEVG